MISRQFLTLLCFWFFIGQVQGQDQILFDLIESNERPDTKQIQIDSFLLAISRNGTKVDLANAYHDLALHWYYKRYASTASKKNLLDAIKYTNKALQLKANFKPLDSISLKRSLYNFGYLQKLNGDLFPSIESHLRLVYLGGKDERVLEAYLELGDSYRTVGDYQKSVDNLKTALTLAQNNVQNYLAQASVHIVLADIL